MFSLSGATKFKYIPNYKDMRGGYDKLCKPDMRCNWKQRHRL